MGEGLKQGDLDTEGKGKKAAMDGDDEHGRGEVGQEVGTRVRLVDDPE